MSQQSSRIAPADATELQRIEQQLQVLQQDYQQLVYTVSHDLQEPLRMVANFSELLRKRYSEQLDDSGQEFLSFLLDGAQRLQAMIEALLKYSRVNTRGAAFAKFDANRLLQNLVEDFQAKSDACGVTMACDPLPTLYGDEKQITCLFQELLQNALQYAASERPLKLRIGAQMDDDACTFSFCDNGVGVDAQDQQRIFAVFKQGRRTASRERLGMGLALSKRIVERHGGRVWTEASEHEGACFYVLLPLNSKESADQ